MSSLINKDKMPNVNTFEVSLESAVHLSPCSYAVHKTASTLKGNTTNAVASAFLYIAKPIDRIIQAVSLPIFTIVDHFRDIYHEKGTMKLLKIIATPLSLPLKLIMAAFISAIILVDGAIQTAVPYQTIHAVKNGKKANAQYFDYQKNQDYPDSIHLGKTRYRGASRVAAEDEKPNRSGELLVW
jgi:hypothetical protein